MTDRDARMEQLFGQLSCGLGRRDEKPNVAVGKRLAADGDAEGVAALVRLLDDPDAAASAVKAIYECGYEAPELLAPHVDELFLLLTRTNNRLVWGGMIAIWCAAKADPDAVWERQCGIIRAFDGGTVITRECAIRAYATAGATSAGRRREATRWLIPRFRECRTKDTASWLEAIFPALTERGREEARKIVDDRLADLSSAARNRVARCISHMPLNGS
jgi:hypothetical protein